MAINPYGLFNNGPSGSPYNDRNYELKRQLETRQQQLSELDRMPSLSAAQQEKRRQLLHAVDQLSGKLEPKSSSASVESSASLNSVGRRDREDGIMIPKAKMDAANAYSKLTPGANSRPKSGYADNEYTNSDRITYKNPQRYDGGATTPGDTYLKGFFVDIKL